MGWSGLGPIAIFLEYVIGLRPDVEKGAAELKEASPLPCGAHPFAPAELLVWDVRQTEEHGVKNYPFGPSGRLDLSCRARVSAASRPEVEVKSSVSLTLELRWDSGTQAETIHVLGVSDKAPGSE